MNVILKNIRRIMKYLSVLVLIFLTCAFLWTNKYYGNIGFSEIVFTLSMPLEGTSTSILYSFIMEVGLKTLVFFALVWLVQNWEFIRKCRFEIEYEKEKKILRFWPDRINIQTKKYYIALGVWLLLLLLVTDYKFHLFKYIRGQILQSNFIKEEYVAATDVELTFPEKKRNLILIFAESLETTMQDKENGGWYDINYIPEMTEYAKENISFSQNEKLWGAGVAPNCGWTIAGIVAETAGIPLNLYQKSKYGNNVMEFYDTFLPGAVTLGDILLEEGYQNYYIQGAKKSFAGKGLYLTQHGKYQIYDVDEAKRRGKLPQDYYKQWGYQDVKLYEFAKEYLLEAAEKGEPFNFSMMTVDTHHPDGDICELCEDTYEGKYYNVFRCASKQLYNFIEWVKQQEFYENTTIVVVGDHCSMAADFFNQSEDLTWEASVDRAVYNVFINSAINTENMKNRKFVTLDFYPTILASLGVEIEGDRLGLGTNLFSGKQTLAEEYGYEAMFEELEKKSIFYEQELLFP